MTRRAVSSVAFSAAIVCFAVAFLLTAGWLIHGDHVAEWKDVGYIALVVGLLAGGAR